MRSRRLCYTMPISRLRCRLRRGLSSSSSSSSSTSRPSRVWSPRAAFDAATERVRAGTLSPEDAHHLFDELLRQADPVPERSLNNFFAALARPPPSAAPRPGLALAIALFNRVCQEEAGLQLAAPSICTYSILMDCCHLARRPDLGLAFFARTLRTGLKADAFVANTLLKCLRDTKRTEEAVDVLLHRMPELGCVPDDISYSLVLKILCDGSQSQRALDLLQMARKAGAACCLGVVSYNTVIHGFCKEGKVSEACDLFHEMMWHGVVPTVVTYSSVIDALCKAGAMDKAELFLRQMIDSGVQPNKVAYTSMIHGYSALGQWKEPTKMFREMTSQGVVPNTVTRNLFMVSLCKHGRSKEAAEIVHEMIGSGTAVSPSTYGIILEGLCRDNFTDEAIVLFQKLNAMNVKFSTTISNTMTSLTCKAQRTEEASKLFAAVSANKLVPNASTYGVMITNLLKEGSMEEADHMFSSMERSGCAPSSVLLNDIIRMLLEKGEVVRAGNYLSKVDGKSISLEASTSLLMMSLFSWDGKYRGQVKSLPARYQFYGGVSHR